MLAWADPEDPAETTSETSGVALFPMVAVIGDDVTGALQLHAKDMVAGAFSRSPFEGKVALPEPV